MSKSIVKTDGRFLPMIAIIVGATHLLALVGIAFFWSWQGLGLLLVFHTFLAVFGISLGHHRCFAHRNFRAKPWVENFLAICSTLCFQGGPIYWSSAHRAHHTHSEDWGDPHSATRGFLWSHVLWVFWTSPNGFSIIGSKKLVRDLLDKPFLRWLDKWNLTLNLSVLALIGVISYLLNRPEIFFWLGPIRIVSVWNVAWATNSFLHGARLFGKSPTGIRNNILGDLFIGGEGWHHAHHERPGTVTHKGFPHWDIGYQVLCLMEKLGLVEIIRPTELLSLSRKAK